MLKDNLTQSRGVALVVALFVLVAFSFMLAAVIVEVEGELKMSAIERNSERALKLAETGVQIARATMLSDTLFQNLTATMEIMQVDGFIQDGYFFAYLGSGFPGEEKWTQWHYDSSVTGNNIQSEITAPLMRVWATAARGQNGFWAYNAAGNPTYFSLENIFPVVAEGVYFPIKQNNDTLIRAHDEYTGSQTVQGFTDERAVWEGDKTVTETGTYSYAAKLSAMASYSNISTDLLTGKNYVTHQALYLTYAGEGSSGSATSSTDTTSTVRLRAVNALCNTTNSYANTLWEFDTGRHGIGTAPVFFDPTPNQPGDEIIYFAMVEMGVPDPSGTVKSQKGANLNNLRDLREWGTKYQDQSEQIYLYAIVDQTTISDPTDPCSPTGNFQVKWDAPFPDPTVVFKTDYPAEPLAHSGLFPPYKRLPSDDLFFLPQEDLLPDYRDGVLGNSACTATDQCQITDSVQNRVFGNVFMISSPPSLSPPVISVMYRDPATGTLYDDRDAAILAVVDVGEPIIDIYLMYAAYSQVKGDGAFPYPYGQDVNWSRISGLKKENAVQVRIAAIRDRLVDNGTCDAAGAGCVWNWSSRTSRYPTFKWTYRVPAWDPARGDVRSWNGYGEFTWDTWFDQHIAPMLNVVDRDEQGRTWAGVGTAGTRNRYNVLYATYKSHGYVDEFGYSTAGVNQIVPPTVAQGAPVTFDTNLLWDDAHFMVMAIRDTWDDWMDKNQTNPYYTAMLNVYNSATANADKVYPMPERSSPVEPYWTKFWAGAVPAAGDSTYPTYNALTNATYIPDPTEAVITFGNYTGAAGTPAGFDSIGFPRPYAWWERLWDTRVMGTTYPHRNLTAQGWSGIVSAADNVTLTGTSPASTVENSGDIDVEGDTAAFCRECLNGEGLIVTVFNEDIAASTLTNSLEDLRYHAISARNGRHVWDYHAASRMFGDVYNGTPAIANNRVFFTYEYPYQTRRNAYITVLDVDTGVPYQEAMLFDNKADAVILSPTIANGAVYVATYDFCNNREGVLPTDNCLTSNSDKDDMTDDWIRLYALSPIIRLLSVGIYPMSTTLSLKSQQNKERLMPRVERKLQVTISGGGSKWEEIRDVYQP